jgi:hypothetical protein
VQLRSLDNAIESIKKAKRDAPAGSSEREKCCDQLGKLKAKREKIVSNPNAASISLGHTRKKKRKSVVKSKSQPSVGIAPSLCEQYQKIPRLGKDAYPQESQDYSGTVSFTAELFRPYLQKISHGNFMASSGLYNSAETLARSESALNDLFKPFPGKPSIVDERRHANIDGMSASSLVNTFPGFLALHNRQSKYAANSALSSILGEGLRQNMEKSFTVSALDVLTLKTDPGLWEQGSESAPCMAFFFFFFSHVFAVLNFFKILSKNRKTWSI